MSKDSKTLKAFANRLQTYIKDIMHHNQVAFIPEIQGWFNICKSVNIINHINGLKDIFT